MKILVVILLIILFIISLILFIKIQVDIKEYKFDSINSMNENSINNNEIYLNIFIYNKILICKFRLTSIIKKFYIKFKEDNTFKHDNMINKFKNEYNYYKKIANKKNKVKLINIEKLYLNMYIDSENAYLTSIVIFILNIIILSIYKKIIYKNSNIKLENYGYNIKSKFLNKNEITFSVKCIINIKVVNAINIILKILILKRKEKKEKNERSSNRKFNDYSYE